MAEKAGSRFYGQGNNETFSSERRYMVENHLAARGISDRQVLDAFAVVPREAFVPDEVIDYAYQDRPLPIGEGQTISQPFIVALTLEALHIRPGDRVLEIGTGSGYAAAILSRVAADVFTVERHRSLADSAGKKLRSLGYTNVKVRCGDGTLGWADYAPFDAIAVAAGGPDAPKALLAQLAIGGRLVIPVGAFGRDQRLLRITRVSADEYQTDDLGGVRFVPLIGEQAWDEQLPKSRSRSIMPASKRHSTSTLIRECAETFDAIETADLSPLLERIGNARVVLIGEATHGTSEFYRMRAEITKQLIEKKGFGMVAIEGDWPDAMHVNRYVTGRPAGNSRFAPFTRFPTWMWRNAEVVQFLEWLHGHNSARSELEERVRFYGLDLYSLFCSIDAVLEYLDTVDAQTADVARLRYGCLSPWESDPASYGRAAFTDAYKSCEHEVVAMLGEMLKKRIEYQERDSEEYFDVVQNARLIANAERYYRAMYYGSALSWNLRDHHMFDTLLSLLTFHGAKSKAVVWAHNSHVGDASATEMSARGELNLGELCRGEFHEQAYIIGFGTHEGTVAAASNWDGEMEVKAVRPSHPESYERLCHDSERPAFLLHLREPARTGLREALMDPRLARAIGVIYRPQTELQSHYFQTVLPLQFDEYIWFDRSTAVHPFDHPKIHGAPDTFPTGI